MIVTKTPHIAQTILASEYFGSKSVAAIEKKHSMGFWRANTSLSNWHCLFHLYKIKIKYQVSEKILELFLNLTTNECQHHEFSYYLSTCASSF